MQLTKEQLTRISDAWGEVAFHALEVLERTASEVARASKDGAPILEKITAARKRATTDLDAAMFAAPALAETIGRQRRSAE
jgi:nucleotidyltransferase/DNA polymerase involved in DNA repair